MALTVATGFVVDDAIVVLENITRHVEQGMPRLRAALLGAREVGFTVLSMSAVADRGVPADSADGRHHWTAVSRIRSDAIAGDHDLAAALVDDDSDDVRTSSAEPNGSAAPGPADGVVRACVCAGTRIYDRSLSWSLDNPGTIMVVLALTIGLNVYLFTIIPKGFFPQQDTGSIAGFIRGDQAISFQLMQQKFRQFEEAIRKDPAVQSVVGFTGGGGGGGPGGQTNSGSVFISLKPLSQRKEFRRPGDCADAYRDRQYPRRAAFPAADLGPAYWRPARQCVISVHDSGGHARGHQYLGAEDHDGAAGRSGTGRRQFRSPGSGAGGRVADRSRDGGAARSDGDADRQHTLRRIRSAPGLDDLSGSSISIMW